MWVCAEVLFTLCGGEGGGGLYGIHTIAYVGNCDRSLIVQINHIENRFRIIRYIPDNLIINQDGLAVAEFAHIGGGMDLSHQVAAAVGVCAALG